ncbi:MAG: GTPase Era [Bacteroidales bacterium]|jgi:GTP-binding protein Era|nr:GTPase Era [Bacteroidales bacterium]
MNKHHSGFVNIIGNPNVGKSTLMNILTGEKLSVVTAKAQTTRHRIMGIINGDDYQIVFSDTPGIIQPKYKMQEGMMDFVHTSLTDADVVIYVTDVVETPGKNREYIEKIAQMDVPVLLIINKIDLATQEKLTTLTATWTSMLPKAQMLAVSAKEKFNVTAVSEAIIGLLPEGPVYFPKDEMSDKPDRFFASEILRGKIFENYRKEIPYCSEVVIEAFKEEANIIHIQSLIYVERETQKSILIGKKGTALKKTATEARKEMEIFFAKKVFLETFIKVRKDWRNNETYLRNLGYLG